MKKILFVFVFLLMSLFMGCSSDDAGVNDEIVVVDFDTCVIAGNDILGTVPRSCEYNGETFKQPTIAERCELEGGKWDYVYYECLGITEEYCKNFIGGVWNDCASPCRHEESEEVDCAAVCVELCRLD